MLQQKIILIVTIFALLLLVYGQSFEGFTNPDVSSAEEISEGASDYYNWGYKEIPQEMEDSVPHTRHVCPRCKKPCYIPCPYRRKKYPCPYCKTDINIKNNFFFIKGGECNKCDITNNKDINKYVLKSSIPACPDMSQFVKKSQMNPSSSATTRPADCPKCPICPICPKCPTTGGGNGGGGGGRNGTGTRMRDVSLGQPSPFANTYTGANDWSQELNGDDNGDNGGFFPGNITGGIPNTTGNDIGGDDGGWNNAGSTPRGGNVPEAYFKDFAYNNRTTGRVKPYNSVWSLFK